MATTCQRCGEENKSGARYCTRCGYDMSSGVTLETPLDPLLAPTPVETGQDLLVGQEVGGCVIEAKIGQGGMGTVYRGTQKSLDRKVAIKILPSHLAQNANYITRFLRESKIVASIKHPNILSVYDRGQAGSIYFFVMEFIRGQTVSQIIMEKGTLSLGDALEIARKSALALATASEEGIIHRDIKPDNIMIDRGGVVKVTDFGLVKNIAETGGITAPQQVMGTAEFMSPEQCEGGEVDHRSDIYSLGMTLYAMLTGSPAFHATTPIALLRKHIDEQPRPIHERIPNIPESIWPVVKKMLAKKTEDRYPDWDAVLDAFETLRENYPGDYSTTDMLRRKGSKRTPSVSEQVHTPTPTSQPQTFNLETPAVETIVSPVKKTKRSARSYIVIGIVAIVALVAAFAVILLTYRQAAKKKQQRFAELDARVADGRKAIENENWDKAASAVKAAMNIKETTEVRNLLKELYEKLLEKCPEKYFAGFKEVRCLEGHGDPVWMAVFSPDSRLVITASDDKTARIWDPETGRELRSLEGHSRYVNTAVLSPDGKHAVTASDDKTARIWNAVTCKVLHYLRHDGPVNSAVFSPDGKFVLTASRDKTARIWNVATGKIFRRLQWHGSWVRSAVFSHDGRFVVTGSRDGTARIWDAATGEELHRLGHDGPVNSAVFSLDGKFVATASDDDTARIWDAAAGRELSSLEGHGDSVSRVVFSPDGRFVVTASHDKTARIWDPETGRELRCLEGHGSYVYSAVFSTDGRFVLTASDDKTIRIWDVATGGELHRLEGHGKRVRSALFSPDGKSILTASDDRTARIWANTNEKSNPLVGEGK